MPKETLMPDKVMKTITFFNKNRIWYTLTRNETAFSCEDAAKKRLRNALVGIPLEDELKTYFGEYVISKGQQQLVLINVRGDCRIDFDLVRSILGISQKIGFASKSTMSLFQIEFGEVNPFLICEIFKESNVASKFEGLITMFDKSLLVKQTTMMTNAGELSWGIEFNIQEVIRHFDNVISNRSFVESAINK